MLTKMYCHCAALLYALKNDQRGVTAIEYAVVGVAIAGLVAVVFTGQGDGSLGKALTDAFAKIAQIIASVPTTPSSPTAS